MNKSLDKVKTYAWKMQPDAVLAQAAAVQNTWYTILDTTEDVRLYYVYVMAATATEDLEVKITIDGLTYTGGTASTNDVWYGYYKYIVGQSLTMLSYATDTVSSIKWATLEGHSVKVEVRKVSAAGANVLNGRVTYAKLMPT